MTTPTLIGLGGRLRAGKDAVADYLVEHHGFVKLGMSDALNEAMNRLNPIVGVEQNLRGLKAVRYAELVEREGYVEAKKNAEVRKLLQRLGTEVGRNLLGEDTWTTPAGRTIEPLLLEGKSVVITGIRYPNEATLIQQFAGYSVWVERPSEVDSSAPAAAHSSENGVTAEDFDTTIINDGTLEDLYVKVERLVKGASA